MNLGALPPFRPRQWRLGLSPGRRGHRCGLLLRERWQGTFRRRGWVRDSHRFGGDGRLGSRGSFMPCHEIAHGHLAHSNGNAVDPSFNTGAKICTLERIMGSKMSRSFRD